MSPSNRIPDAPAGAPRTSERPTAPRAGPVRRRWGRSAEELFGREPFTYGSEPRYYGTGVAGYTTGPGFTGGYYGFGEEPPGMPTELEREYAREVYGAEWPSAVGGYAAPGGLPQRLPPAQWLRKYPPGPKGYRRTDERIREDVCDRLMRARHIDSSDVTVQVAGAKVALEGTVPQRRMKHAIEDIAASCLGVEDIENRIRVTAPSSTR